LIKYSGWLSTRKKSAGILLLALLWWGNLPAARAQNPDQEAPRMLRYGVVDVDKLPHGQFSPRRGHHLPFLVPDPASFLQDKANVNSGRPGGGGGGGGSGLAKVVSNSQVVIPGVAGMTVNDSSVGAIPPDTQVSVGPNCIVEAVNDTVRMIGRGGTPCPAMDTDLYTFFGADIFFTDVVSDPIILYDAASGHFLFSVVTLETLLNQADWRFAISQTSDPTGPWNLYIATFTGSFPDFPKIGFSDDKVAITGDSFTISTQTYQGSEFLVLKKADLINNVANPAQQFFGPNQGFAAIEPANSLSSTTTLYMAASGSSRKGGSVVRVWSIKGVPGALNVAHTDLAIGALKTPPDALQKGGGALIVTNDTSLLNAVYRNGNLWVSGNTACTPAGDSTVRSCAHFTEISTSGLTPVVVQDFTFGQNGQYYYYPAIQIDSSGNLIAVLNRSSSTEFPSVVASGQKISDGANAFEAPAVLKEGEVAYTPSSAMANRWGDYSGAALDPLDPTMVVLAGEYAASLGNIFEGTGNDNWATWIGEIHF
jgi:hypothetical protein